VTETGIGGTSHSPNHVFSERCRRITSPPPPSAATIIREPLSNSCTPRGLNTPEDVNWLSELQCFVRSELIQVFCATSIDVEERQGRIQLHQVGLRCRHCAGQQQRASRAVAFPSSSKHLYQSFTMMLREHFSICNAMPVLVQEKLQDLQSRPQIGAFDSRAYWIHSAQVYGLTSNGHGLFLNAASMAQGAALPPFGAQTQASLPMLPEQSHYSPFLNRLRSQLVVVRLHESERKGSRRTLPVGLAGLACRHCTACRRGGNARVYGPQLRSMPQKLEDVHHHLLRCELVDNDTKEKLKEEYEPFVLKSNDRIFYGQLWDHLKEVELSR